MNFRTYLQIAIFFIIFIYSKEQKLSLETYTTKKYKFYYNSYYDLFNVQVECPNMGVMKNFVLRRDTYSFWYEFQCYSSLSEEVDYGEPIIKGLTLTTSREWQANYINSEINYLNNYPVDCWVDYALNSFALYFSNGLKRLTSCKGIKPSFTSQVNVKTVSKTCDYRTFDCLFDIKVGRTDEENDVDIGYPLRGFKYIVDSSRNNYYPTVYILYSYSKLRNMQIVKDSYKQRFEQLRNSNTQKN